MRILVTVKRVIDYNIKVRVKSDQTDVDLTNVKMSINPFDEIAVEEGVRLREKNLASELIVLSIGSAQSQETLRSALALGADRGILVQTDQKIEPLNVAKIIKTVVDREKVDLVILGKQAIDDDSNQTGQMLAALLVWPQGTFISKLTVEESMITVEREVDGGLDTLTMPLPAVVTTDLRLNIPRYPKLPNIMKAKQKPLEIIDLDSLNLNLKDRQSLLKVIEPPPRKAGIKVKEVSELIPYLTQQEGISR